METIVNIIWEISTEAIKVILERNTNFQSYLTSFFISPQLFEPPPSLFSTERKPL